MKTSLCSLLMYGGATVAAVQGQVQWSSADGGNDHWYLLVYRSEPITWANASIEAEKRSHEGHRGYLATFHSPGEHEFVFRNVGPQADSYWIGGYQPIGSPEPGGNWQWVTGEPFTFSHWLSGEPNDRDGIESAIEVPVVRGGGWNDQDPMAAGFYFMVEFGTPVPEPSVYALLTLGGLMSLGILRKRARSRSN